MVTDSVDVRPPGEGPGISCRCSVVPFNHRRRRCGSWRKRPPRMVAVDRGGQRHPGSSQTNPGQHRCRRQPLPHQPAGRRRSVHHLRFQRPRRGHRRLDPERALSLRSAHTGKGVIRHRMVRRDRSQQSPQPGSDAAFRRWVRYDVSSLDVACLDRRRTRIRIQRRRPDNRIWPGGPRVQRGVLPRLRDRLSKSWGH